MRRFVLGLVYRRGEYEATRNEWRQHGIEFDFADDFQQAIRELSDKDYRKKLKIAPDVPDYIKNIYSVGYKFEP